MPACEKDRVTKFDDITKSQAPANYLFHKTLKCMVFYNLTFCATTGFLKIFGGKEIDKDSHVQLVWCGDFVPSPQSFVQYFNHYGRVIPVLFSFRKLSPGSTCIYPLNSGLGDLICYLAL